MLWRTSGAEDADSTELRRGAAEIKNHSIRGETHGTSFQKQMVDRIRRDCRCWWLRGPSSFTLWACSSNR